MKLHLAIRKLIESRGVNFLRNEQFVNALNDYCAFDNNPAEKNIMRILLQEGYAERILKSNGTRMAMQNLWYGIERDYGINRRIAQHIIESMAYGVGYIQKEDYVQPVCINNNTVTPSNVKDAPSTRGMPKTQATTDEFSSITGIHLVKYKRNVYRSVDGRGMYHFTKSKYYDLHIEHRYWFTYHRKDILLKAPSAYYVLECADKAIFVIPISFFEQNVSRLNPTVRPQETYWHLHVKVDSVCTLKTNSMYADLDITPFRIK